MDSEIKELKELVRNQSALIEENNRMLHSMRRAARWSMILRVIWWLTIIGVTGALYVVYVSPYVEGILDAYGNALNVLRNFPPPGQ